MHPDEIDAGTAEPSQSEAVAQEFHERLKAAHARSESLRAQLHDSDSVCAALEAALATINERQQTRAVPQSVAGSAY